jgi:hypothetical protein
MFHTVTTWEIAEEEYGFKVEPPVSDVAIDSLTNLLRGKLLSWARETAPQSPVDRVHASIQMLFSDAEATFGNFSGGVSLVHREYTKKLVGMKNVVRTALTEFFNPEPVAKELSPSAN